jgi:peptidoglycan hydrolase-like protein with peptidoglycan-binding domain
MSQIRRLVPILALLSVCLVVPQTALAMGSPRVAALQVALRARHLYSGSVDGERGPATTSALVRLQRQAGLAPDGILGPLTRRVLGRLGGPGLGARPLRPGTVGADVVELQFLLAWHGFPSGTIDGAFGAHTEGALLRFQRFAGLPAAGIAGPATVAALRGPLPTSPLVLAWPLRAPVGDRFGPRGNRFHSGIDIKAPYGTPVRSAGPGRVVLAGPTLDGYGNLVIVAHASGVETYYAHLSRVLVSQGEAVAPGSLLGIVGATGHAFGPHLHFEVRVRDATIDPLGALG